VAREPAKGFQPLGEVVGGQEGSEIGHGNGLFLDR
jgi:hypothetical protein